MKKRVGVWIDTEKAVIISLKKEKKPVNILPSQPGKRMSKSPKVSEDIRSVVSSPIETKLRIPGDTKEFARSGNQHYSTELKNEHKLKNEKRLYFRNILKGIKDVDEIVLFGPSILKKELQAQIEKDPQLYPRLKAVEPANIMSDRQMVRWVENYYMTADLSRKQG